MSDFTILTPVRNGAETIDTCLASVQEQSLDVQHLVIYGRSIDETWDIIKGASTGRVEILQQNGLGIYNALNKGIRRAKGEIIGILNADDFYINNLVLKNVSRIFQNPEIDSCYGDLVYVSRKDANRVVRYWKSGAFRRELFYNGWMPPHPTFFVRRKIYRQYGLFNPELGTSADYELMLRFLFRYRVSTAYIPEVMVCMRTGGVSGASIAARVKANLMDRRAWWINDLRPKPWTLWLKPLRKLPQYIIRKPLGGQVR